MLRTGTSTVPVKNSVAHEKGKAPQLLVLIAGVMLHTESCARTDFMSQQAPTHPVSACEMVQSDVFESSAASAKCRLEAQAKMTGDSLSQELQPAASLLMFVQAFAVQKLANPHFSVAAGAAARGCL